MIFHHFLTPTTLNPSQESCAHVLEGRHRGLVQVVQAEFQRSKAASGSDDGIYCTSDEGQGRRGIGWTDLTDVEVRRVGRFGFFLREGLSKV